MSITHLSIQGFQSHKATKVNFSDGLNCITGNSDTGKSAILRSLIWTITNKSSDKSFRTKGMAKSDVEITFSDSKEVSRVQDNQNAYFLVDYKNKLDLEFKAFKQLIPEDVAEAINMNELNISSQFDSPFLLSDSPGEVARKLNQVSGLSDIDSAISNIRKQVLANSREISNVESILADLEIQKSSFAYLEQMEKDVSAYELLNNQISIVANNHFSLGVLLENMDRIQENIDALNCFLNVEKEYDAVLTITEELKRTTDEARQLGDCLCDIVTRANDIIELNYLISAESDLKSVENLIDESESVKNEFVSLDFAVKRILINEGRIRTFTKKLECAEFEFHSLMPSSCPLCGGATK